MRDERVLRSTDLPKREITAADLKKVKEGFSEIVSEIGPDLTLGQFATLLRKAKELAADVGGLDVLADCADALEELQQRD